MHCCSPIVDTARAIFKAKAASVFLLDEETDELVFEAVSGEGEDDLIGMRFPSSTGIAGWVLVTRQPLVDRRPAGRPALRTGGGRVDGVRAERARRRAAADRRCRDRRPVRSSTARSTSRSRSAEMDLLTLFANQAAIGLDLLRRGRQARALLEGDEDGAAAVVARVATLLERSDDTGDGLRLLEALEALLRRLD